MAEKKIKKEKIDNVGIHSFSKKADIFFSTISGLIPLLYPTLRIRYHYFSDGREKPPPIRLQLLPIPIWIRRF